MKDLYLNYRHLFQNKNYLKILFANICNRFGDNIDALTLAWLVYDISKSPALSAIYFGINTLPTILFQPLLGPFIEKHNLKKILVLSDILRGCCIFFLFILLLMHQISANAIIMTTFFLSSFEAFRLPASTSIMVQILDEQEYESGIALHTSLSNVTEIIGMASAGAIIYLGGMKAAIFIDTLTFFISAFLLSTIKGHYQNSPSCLEPYFQSLKNAFHYLIKQKNLLFLSILVCLMNATLVPYNSFESVIVRTYYEKNIEIVSLISISITFFSMLASFFYPKVSKYFSAKQILIFTFLSFAIFYLFILGAIYFHTHTFVFYMFILLQSLILGLGISIGNIQASVLSARYTDKNYLSRVFAMRNALSRLTTPLVAFILSFATAFLSIPKLLFIFICLILFLILSLIKFNMFHYLNS